MNTIIIIVLSYIVGHSIGFNSGFIKAHKEIATEIKKLGKFFVGNEVFTCIKTENKD